MGSATWTKDMVPMNQLILDESSVSKGILNLILEHHFTFIASLTREALTQYSGVLALVEEKMSSQKGVEAGEWEREREWKNFMINKLFLVHLYSPTSTPLD